MTIKEMGVKIRDELCLAASLPGSGSPVTEPIAAILKRPTDGGGGGVASVRLKAEEVSLGSGNTATKTNKQSDTNTTVKLDHLTTVGGVRGASNVQTIQVSTAAGGVQTIKVALPPGTQTLAKVTPHQLAKVASQAVSRGSGSGAVKGAVAMKGTHIQTAVGGTNITPDTLLNTQHITALTQGGVVVSGGGSGNKTRSPIVTLTTREAARLTPHSPTPTTTTTTTPSPTTHHHHHHHHHTQSSGSSVGVGKLTTTQQQQQASPTTHKSTTTSLFSLGGIKLLQAAPQQLTGKVRSNSPSVANSITKLQTLVVDGKVLMQGAKAMSGGGVGNTGKQQVITGVFPGQQLTTVESLLSQGDKAPQIQGGVITTLAGNKLTGGNVIQVGSGSGNSGVQRLTLVSPGASHHVPLTAASQRLILATASQAGKLDPSSINKTQVVQTIQTLQPAVLQTNQHHTTTNTHTSAAANTHTSATNTTQARFFSVGQHHQKAIVQGLNVGGKPSVLSASGLRLMQPGVVGGAGGAGAGGGVGGGGTAAPTTGNLITIGGKQVLLTSKPFSQQGQLQQVMLTSGGGGSSISQQSSSSSSSNSSSGTVVVASGAGGQIVLPASALQGSQLNLKGLQAFHTLKVIPASQVTPQQRGKPVLARIVSPAAVRTANITTQQHDANTKS
ncbi:hypothetical protein Pcinc_003725 [Petrolisthes cinctipes]|uniref:Uncharacterized protein n=1 Tax=Petrolisthes cinctipes TaxID=88211 RepID=A0AAE1L135_PETCI|nr:hypothetical protein Pcinc_003725 [Petrolisthes cinctipes]